MGLCCRGNFNVLLSSTKGSPSGFYVSQNPKTKKITDFFSFFSLPSSVIGNVKYSVLDAAYLYYYATETALEPQAEESGALKRRLEDLIKDALIVADRAKFDVVNALTLMDNVPLLEPLKVGCASHCCFPNRPMFALCSSELATDCSITTSTTGELAHSPAWKAEMVSSPGRVLESS